MTYWEIGDTVALGCQFAERVRRPDRHDRRPDDHPARRHNGHAVADARVDRRLHLRLCRHAGRSPLGALDRAPAPIVAAFNDVFDVHSAAAPQLFSIAEARSALREPAATTTDDEEIRGYIVAATRVVEDVYGPVVPATVYRPSTAACAGCSLTRSSRR
jgi:hypothetical protein